MRISDWSSDVCSSDLIAAEGLEGGSGIASRTIASLEYQWGQGREQLGPRDVLVIDEAGMIGTRQMERVLGEAERAGAKVVLVGDAEQLQAIEAGAAFRALGSGVHTSELQSLMRISFAVVCYKKKKNAHDHSTT